MSSDGSSNPQKTWQLDALVDVIGLTPRVLSTFPGKCENERIKNLLKNV